jgi:hypothetical protein
MFFLGGWFSLSCFPLSAQVLPEDAFSLTPVAPPPAATATAPQNPPAVAAPAPLAVPPPPVVIAPAASAPAVVAPATPALPAEPSPPTQIVPLGTRPLLGPPVVLEEQPFEVDAMDNDSALAILHLAQSLPGIASRFFSWPEIKPATIQIHLVPAAVAEFSGPFVITEESNGHCAVLIRWGPSTQFSDVCLAVATVSLQSIAVSRAGYSAAARAPGWLTLAFGKILEAGLKPPLVEELATQAQDFPVLTLKQLMTPPPVPYDEDAQRVVAVNGYWLARILADGSRNSAVADTLFAALLAGADPARALTDAFPDQFDNPRDLELWWQIGYRDYVRSHAPPVQTMAQSRAQLDRLEYLEIPQKSGGPKPTRLDAAWPARTDAAVRGLIGAEVVQSRSLPVQTNPVYYNALLSLLLALNDLHGDNEKAFRASWAKYLDDRAAAEVTENEVEAAMSAGK